jgi:hypothetical protein
VPRNILFLYVSVYSSFSRSINVKNMDGLAVTTAPRRGPCNHASEEWKAHRIRIKQLYVDKRKKLSDVRQIMETAHGFYATLVLSALCRDENRFT